MTVITQASNSVWHRVPIRMYRYFRRAVLATLLLALVAFIFWPRHGVYREVNETTRIPLSSPEGSPWTTENALPNLKFFEPVCIVAAHDSSQRLFVLERRGTIQVVQDDASTKTKTLVADFSAQVYRTEYEDDGALGLALHPEFGNPDSANRNYLYVFYTANVDGDCHDRLSRFTMKDGSSAVEHGSELVLIDQLDRNLWHNGGALEFGDDGFLYVGVGDEGELNDEYGNGQRIDHNLYSGILRIDVDHIGGSVSHPVRRQPADGRTAHYYIPSDNPFVGVPDALEEFWSIGLRNPHRISHDAATDRWWVGDVGQDLREEVNIASPGSNHQWSYAEGRLAFHKSYLGGVQPSPLFGIDTPPVYDYPHVNMNNCVIGGVVYRGSELPELFGKYIYGDNGSGRVWAMTMDSAGEVSNEELFAVSGTGKTGMSSFGVDAEGEVLLLILGESNQVDGTVHRIIAAGEAPSTTLPPLLSETGIFADMRSLKPADGVLPYGVTSPLWSDGAVKRRWIILPGNGEDPDPEVDRIQFSLQGAWKFPTGTIFVKHFELPIDETNPASVKRLETRLLVLQDEERAYGVTYRWNAEGTDAVLLDSDALESISVKTSDGGSRKQVWHYPSRENCAACHTKTAHFVLGVSTRQLNGDYDYTDTGITRNQLREWSRAGMFTSPLGDEQYAESPQMVSVHDSTASLVDRSRSYLDANCAGHRPGGVRAQFDARYTTPLDKQNLIDGPLSTSTEIPEAKVVAPGNPSRSMLIQRMLAHDNRMPPLGVLRRDTQAISVLCQWIDSLAPADGPVAPADPHRDENAPTPAEKIDVRQRAAS